MIDFRRSAPIGRAWCAPSAWLVLMVLLPVAGCNSRSSQVSNARQTARDQSQEQIEKSRAESRQALAEIEKVREALDRQEARFSGFEQRLSQMEAQLAAQKGVNIPELASAIQACQQDLKEFKGDHVGLDYRTNQRFEEVALIHANLAQADEDLRKHVATTVTNLEQRTENERAELAAELAKRLEDQRTSLISSYRELEREAISDRTRTAQAMQAVRNALASEQTAVQAHSDQLTRAIKDLETHFGATGAAVRAQDASQAFADARRLHREYLDQRHKPELATQAIDAYRRGLELQPDAIEMHFELARLLRVAQRDDDARPHLEYYLAHGQDPERVAQVRSWLGQ